MKLVTDPTGSRKYFEFEKFYVFEHLAVSRILPGNSDYSNLCEDTIYLICGLDRENVSPEVSEIIQKEAHNFAKNASDKWKLKSVRYTESKFLKKFNQPGSFLKNLIKIPGPLKKERIVPAAAKKKKSKSKFRKVKAFGNKTDRAQRYAAKKVSRYVQNQ